MVKSIWNWWPGWWVQPTYPSEKWDDEIPFPTIYMESHSKFHGSSQHQPVIPLLIPSLTIINHLFMYFQSTNQLPHPFLHLKSQGPWISHGLPSVRNLINLVTSTPWIALLARFRIDRNVAQCIGPKKGKSHETLSRNHRNLRFKLRGFPRPRSHQSFL